jgi:hypothetical protein
MGEDGRQIQNCLPSFVRFFVALFPLIIILKKNKDLLPAPPAACKSEEGSG